MGITASGICAFLISFLSPHQSFLRSWVNHRPESMVVTSKSQVARQPNPYRVYRLEKGGVAITNQTFRNYQLYVQPQTGMPVLRSEFNPSAKLRLIFLPGSGADVSTVAPLISVIQAFEQLNGPAAEIKNERMRRLRETRYPAVNFAHEVVAFDMPGAGWAPEIEDVKNGVEMANFVKDVITELDEERPLLNILIARSASSPIALGAHSLGAPIGGVCMYGATFPDAEVLAANRIDVQAHHDAGDYTANWRVLDGYLAKVQDPKLVTLIQKAGASNLPILNLIGSEDGQVPKRARDLWRSIVLNGAVKKDREQVLIDGTGHFVFSAPTATSATFDAPDMIAFAKTVDFILRVQGGP